jgi:16S rRNA (cytidine1402-2'-O)-methyltransferase
MSSGQQGIAWASDRLIGLAGIAAQDMPAGALYVVATPIGNIADITLRALWVLAHADAIAAEDTRVTRSLLARYEIAPPKSGVFAAHAHNERGAAQRIVDLLAEGARVALVTDAGTPAVSDPGARIVAAAREAGHRVVPIPGPSSALAALSVAGFAEGGFSFIGFAPTGAKNRARALNDAAACGDAFVLFEAPHRVVATLRELAAVLAPARRALVARELTKVHETLTVLAAAELGAWVEKHEPRGEYVIAVDAAEQTATTEIDAVTRRWLDALAAELPASRAAAVAAKVTGVSRDALYAALGRRNRHSAP